MAEMVEPRGVNEVASREKSSVLDGQSASGERGGVGGLGGLSGLSGETRVLSIVGDPIAQVKSPAGMTQVLREHGHNAVLVPMHVSPVDLSVHIKGFSVAKNVDGIIVTVPHKFAVFAECASTTERARFLGAVNVLRRNADGSWHGDMCDGEGFVGGMRAVGGEPSAKRALLVGAGGAGSAIALALLENGVASLAIHDEDPTRRDALISRLQGRFADKVSIGSDDPTGFELVVNATPVGMKASDPYPLQADKLTAAMFVGDAITAPAVTPLIEAARALGCNTQVGGGMFAAVRDLMLSFLLEAGPLAKQR